MKWLALWKAEVKLTAPKLPLVLLCVLSILFAIFVSLPPALLSSVITRNITLTVVCETSPALARLIAGMATDYALISRTYVADDEAMGQERLSRGEADVLLVIAGDIEAALLHGEAVTLSVQARDDLSGTLAYLLADSTVEALNSIESITRDIYYRAQAGGMSAEESNRELYRFANQLFFEALDRFSHIEEVASARPYEVFAVSLTMFLTVSISAVFITVTAAGQIAGGYLRRLAVHGIATGKLIAVKLANAAILALVLGIFTLVGFHALGIAVDAGRYFLAIFSLSVIVTGICLALISLDEQKNAAVSRSLLSCAAVLLLLLFWGGGFYPAYLMRVSFRNMNPAWLARLLADWNFTGQLPAADALILFLLPLAAGVLVATARFGKVV